MWQIQGGITKNWFGMGNTALYGEYNRAKDWGAEIGGRNFITSTCFDPIGFTVLRNVTSTEATVWGVGLVQNIDAAATELYIGYRRFEIDFNADAVCTTGAPGAVMGNTAPAAAGTPFACNMDGFDIVTAGARVKF